VGDIVRNRRQPAAESTSSHGHNMPIGAGGKDGAGRGVKPFQRLAEHQIANLFRIKRFVSGANERQLRVRFTKAAFQRTLALTKAGGEVWADTLRGWHRILDFQRRNPP
jgi:hypothetical protein